MNDYLGNLTTESVNKRTKHIDECSRIYLLIRLSTFGGATPLRKSKQIFIAREKLTWYSCLRFLLFTGTCKIIMEQEEGHSQSMPFFTLDMYQKKLSRDNLDNEVELER